jgi:tetratricopeptide (TPR) repeat protein
MLFILGGLLIVHRVMKRGSEEANPWWLRLLATALAVWVISFGVRTAREGGGPEVALALVEIILPLVLLTYIWLPTFVELMTSGMTGAFTGGNDQIESKAYYFRAEALRKKGDYEGAIAAIDEVMEQFPGDFDGLMLRAEVYAVDYKNLSAARLQLEEIEADSSKTVDQKVLAALKRAELFLNQDLELSRSIWERIAAEHPNSPAGNLATQQLAHLTAKPVSSEDQGPLVIGVYEQNIGLVESLAADSVTEVKPTGLAAQLVKQLMQYPDDLEAREKLATAYAEEYGNVPLAVEQFRILAEMEGQTTRRRAEWLTRMAEVLVKNDSDLPNAKAVLQEIIDRFPDTSWCVAARTRLATIERSSHSHQRTSPLKIGVYEQNIGLKRTPPAEPTASDPS